MTTRTDTVSRWMAASADAVYRAMVDADAVVVWLPPEGMTGEIEQFEPWPGGLARIALVYDDVSAAGKTDANRDVSVTEFVVLEPGVRVVQRGRFESDDPSLAGDITFSWLLAPGAGGTTVTVVAEGVPAGIGEADHLEGIGSSLANLARYVENRPR